MGACPQASQGARGDGGTSLSPTWKVLSKAPPEPDPGGACRPAAPRRALSSHLLQKWGFSSFSFAPSHHLWGFLGSNQIIPPHSAPAPLSELIVMPSYCLLTILRHCKLISPWLIFSRVILISNLLQSPCSSPLTGARWPQPLGTTLSPTRDSEQTRWPGLQAGRLQQPVEICPTPRTRQHRAKAEEARECSEPCPSCSPVHTRSRVQLPAPQISAGPHMLSKSLPHYTLERSPQHPQKQGSQRHWGTCWSTPQQRESPAEEPEPAKTREQRWPHEGKVDFEVFPLLLVP